MKNKKIIIILICFIVALIISIFSIYLKAKKTNDKTTINEGSIEVNISNPKKTVLGYETVLSVINNINQSIKISTVKVTLMDIHGEEISQLYFDIDKDISSKENYKSNLITDQDLSNVEKINYEIIKSE